MELCGDGHEEICFETASYKSECPACAALKEKDEIIEGLRADIDGLEEDKDGLNEEIGDLEDKLSERR